MFTKRHVVVRTNIALKFYLIFLNCGGSLLAKSSRLSGRENNMLTGLLWLSRGHLYLARESPVSKGGVGV